LDAVDGLRFPALGITARFSRIESERFVIDRTYHTWVYDIWTGLKLRNCRIELPKGAEDITVTNVEHDINLRPETNVFTLEKRTLPFLSRFELFVSFVTRPRMDEVVSYVSEESEIANHRRYAKIITVQNRQSYVIERIRLKRAMDFEPRIFKVEELSLEGDIEVVTALVETSRDKYGRVAKSFLSWETNFSPLERKRFRISYELLAEEERTATIITKLVIQANLLFKQITSVKQIFRDTMLIADELHTPCRSERDFANKIGVLCQLFDVKLRPLRQLLGNNVDQNWQSIKLLEEWLQRSGLAYDSSMIETWRNIVEIRNKSPPFHQPDNRIIELCKFFNQGYPPDYPDFWISIINKLKESLQHFVEVLGTALTSLKRDTDA
jgi:hypothetical protein